MSTPKSGYYSQVPMYQLPNHSAPRLRSPTIPSLPLHSPSSSPPRSPTLPSRRRSPKWMFPPSRWRQVLLRPGALFKICCLLSVITGGVLFFFTIYEPYFELQLHPRKWIRQEVEAVGSLSGCFEEGRVSESYNVSENVYGRKRWEVQGGVGMKLGRDCYEFAGTVGGGGGGDGWGVGEATKSSTGTGWVPPPHSSSEEWTNYHTYWRTDLAPFGPRQEDVLKSFFATQPISHSRLILWSNGPLSQNTIIAKYLRIYPDSFEVRIVNLSALTRGTALEGSEMLRKGTQDEKAWVDGDLVRLLVMWSEGGVWIDMDMLLTRSFEPLLDHEFVTQWDCYDKTHQPFNGALMHFRKQSPYLCEAFHIMATSPPPRASSTDWGSLLYLKLYRRLLHASIPPFKILPWCFIDGVSCRLDNRLPDPFVPDVTSGTGFWGSRFSRSGETKNERRDVVRTDPSGRWNVGEGGDLDGALGKVFGVHLHNRWEKQFPKDGWVSRLLLARYRDRLWGMGPGMGGRTIGAEEL
ncbi:hypothetical protein JAAARDRAFT_680368 [Jaapia argillacea MUCL 33604]|uniref:Glycosyltransferase family 32 protein n=1 Tax=Jaapia argillacea MUCL 33604 TaxID=933084 RepID=A0A067Q5K9_9AGAM|nr:hypothetical protein JAAARDRAFT_680368 [Jaapia argillacea MUCL 33604]